MPYILTDFLINSAIKFPDKVAVKCIEKREYTYREMYLYCRVLALYMISQGIKKGDRIAIVLPNSFEHIISIFASSIVGGVFVSVNPNFTYEQIKHIMNDCDCKMIISSSNILTAICAEVSINTNVCLSVDFNINFCFWNDIMDKDILEKEIFHLETSIIDLDLASIIYTSGSTGNAKGIMLSHRNIVTGTKIVSDYLDINCDERILGLLPLNFDYGLNQLLTCFFVGATYYIKEHINISEIPSVINKHKITGLAGIPTTWIVLLNQNYSKGIKFPNLRYITNSGGTIPAKYLDLLPKMFEDTQIYLMYGITEGFRCTYLLPNYYNEKKGSIGKAVPNAEVRILKDNQVCEAFEHGELVFRSSTVAMGYWNNPGETKRVFKKNQNYFDETILYTGDIVYSDEDGFLFFVERNDSLIKSQGFRISPTEIEEVIHSHSLVEECVVIGQKDDLVGEKIIALIKTKNNCIVDLEEIKSICRKKLPYYMMVSRIVLLNEINKTSTGKYDRVALKKAYQR